MVLIGFLSRVFGTLSSNLKAAVTPIILIEVDRPKIEQGDRLRGILPYSLGVQTLH